MKRDQARAKAHEIWGRRQTPGVQSVGDRLGAVTLRTKKTDPLLRYEVGYYETTSVSPEKWDHVIVGRGASWEDAFLVASRQRGAA